MMRYGVLILGITLALPFGKVLREDLNPDREIRGAVFRGESLRLVSGPFSPLLADLLWMRVVQTYGDSAFRREASEEDWRLLFEWTNSVTELDPEFFIPYYFAGIIFPWESPLVYEAIGLDKKGMIYLPNEWRLPFLIGFNLFYFAGRKAKAAHYLERAVSLPGSPSYLPRLVARLLYESGNTRAAVAFLEEVLKNVDDLGVREQIAKRKEALRRVLLLEEALQAFERKMGRPPRDLGELVREKIIRKIPTEPYGGTFYWDDREQRIKSTSNFLFKGRNRKGENRGDLN